MTDLSTTYMGIKLKNPIIAGASALTADMTTIRQIAENGAGALVTKSLLEEEIELERFKFEEDLHKNDARHAEMITTHPDVKFAGADEHLMWVREAKESVDIPVFASLNAVHRETWKEYAKRLEDTGVDGLEFNLFASPKDPDKPGTDIENEQVELIAQLKDELSVPFSVKLSYFYSNPANMVRRFDNAGASGAVLFNRLFEPDIDPDKLKNIRPFNLSHETDHRLPLRFVGLLHGAVGLDLCASTGIFTGKHVAKMLLAGAQVVQTVSSLFQNGVSHVSTLVRQLEEWMAEKDFTALDDFRGKLSKEQGPDPWVYTRAQYAKLLMNPEKLIENFPTM